MGATLAERVEGLRVEKLGDGAVYCRLVNHYCPGAIAAHRIIHHPNNHYEATLNLKQLQIAVGKLSLPISIDIHRLAQQHFADNWTLLQQLHHHLYTSPVIHATTKQKAAQLA